MHYIRIEMDDYTPGFDVHHNGDWSGDVIILQSGEDQHEIILPFELLEKLLMEKQRGELIGKLEQAEGKKLRKLLGWKDR